MKKSLILPTLVLSIFILIGLSVYYSVVVVKSYDYQIGMLHNGNTKQRMEAMNFFVEKKSYTLIIPILMENIDNKERSFWSGEPKGGQVSLSCVSTVLLYNITEGWKWGGGHTCYGIENFTDSQIIQQWRDWYKNDYPKWLDEQNGKILPRKLQIRYPLKNVYDSYTSSIGIVLKSR